MADRQRIEAAEEMVEVARDRFVDSVQMLAFQLEPRRLVRELWQDAKVKGADLAEEAVDAVKARPVAATGVAAAVAMFLARQPLGELAGKLLGSGKKKAREDDEDERDEDEPSADDSSPPKTKRQRRRKPADDQDTENNR